MIAASVRLPRSLGVPSSSRAATDGECDDFHELQLDDFVDAPSSKPAIVPARKPRKVELLPKKVNAAQPFLEEASLIIAFKGAVRLSCAFPPGNGRVDPLPLMAPRAELVHSPAVVTAAVAELQAHLGDHGYNALGAANLSQRDEGGRVNCQLMVLGFPVNERGPMLDPSGTGIAKSMQPFLMFHEQLGGDEAGIVVIDIHPRAAAWTACRDGLLDPNLKKKMAKLILAIPWTREVHAFGKHAIEALRSEMGAHSQLLGDRYGLCAPRYAFTNGSAVVVGFVHPQNLLPGWAGGETAACYARILDEFAMRYRAREGLPPPTVSVERWVDHELAEMSPGQLRFERIGQLRTLEKRAVANGGTIKPFDELPEFAKLMLEAVGKGRAFWAEPMTEWDGHASPLAAILSINGQIGCAKRGRAWLEASGISKEELARDCTDADAREALGRDLGFTYGAANGAATSATRGRAWLEASGYSKEELARDCTDADAREALGRDLGFTHGFGFTDGSKAGKKGGAKNSSKQQEQRKAMNDARKKALHNPESAAAIHSRRNEFYWSDAASANFNDAITELGGVFSAKASQILQILSLGPLHNVSFHQVASRLQKLRQRSRDATSQLLPNHAVAPATSQLQPHAVAQKKLKRPHAYSSGNFSDDDDFA